MLLGPTALCSSAEAARLVSHASVRGLNPQAFPAHQFISCFVHNVLKGVLFDLRKRTKTPGQVRRNIDICRTGPLQAERLLEPGVLQLLH